MQTWNKPISYPGTGQTVILLLQNSTSTVTVKCATYKAFGIHEEGYWTWNLTNPNEPIIESTILGWLPLPVNTYHLIETRKDHD